MASKGEAFAPCSTAKEYSQFTSSALPATTPRVASLWPAMALVAECTTRSTPCSRGRWPSGVAKVESTTVTGPAREPISSRSTRSSRGLAGVSATTRVVFPGRTAAAKAPGSVASTKVTSMPNRGHAVCSSSCVPA